MMVDERTAAEVVVSSISYVLEIPEAAVREDSRLAEDLGADSLAIVQIADVVERSLRDREIAVVIDDGDLPAIHTVAAAIEYLVAKP